METVHAAAQGLGSPVTLLTWTDVRKAAEDLWERVSRSPEGPPDTIYGIPTGGCLAALAVQRAALADGYPVDVLDEPNTDCLIIDDLVDSGKTLQPFLAARMRTDALFRKPASPAALAPLAHRRDGWLKFPWERDHAPTDAVVRLLQFMGENPHRDGLIKTPHRVIKMWGEMCRGYQEDPKAILATVFDVAHDELVLLRGVEFTSMCEHHLLPFYGVAHVGYIPNGTGPVVGLSKLARLVECFARRLQVQERMTQEVAQAIQEHLRPQGVGVVIKARHACMGCRGIQKPDAEMVTSCMLGLLRTEQAARAEFLALLKV